MSELYKNGEQAKTGDRVKMVDGITYGVVIETELHGETILAIELGGNWYSRNFEQWEKV